MKALVPGLRKLVRNYPSALSTRTSSSFPSRTSTQTHRLAHTMAAVGHRYIDIGANLTDDMYQGMYNDKTYHAPDLEIVLKRAFAAGVERIIVTAGDLEQSKAALKLAQTDPRLFFTVGCHPTRAGEFDTYAAGPDAYLEALYEVAKEGIALGKTVAIGECGLDNDRLHFCDAETQRRNFALQFTLQKRTCLPMFLHMRAATKEFCEIVRQHYPENDLRGVVHSFDGSLDELQEVLSLGPGVCVGLNGCSLKTEENVQVGGKVPLDRLMVETDAPWCEIKSTHAGKQYVKSTDLQQKDKKKHDPACLVKGRNEPCRIGEVVDVLAGAHKASGSSATREEIAEAAFANTMRVFFS